ncbi:hypothetical protein CsSME_00049320 [Camellia sinensis var. sinensis]
MVSTRRSIASCFKIITYSSDAIDEDDDIDASESKGSSDKRGWSFQKIAARHRVLSNIVISLNKDGPETATVKLLTRPNTAFQEKTSEWDGQMRNPDCRLQRI